MRSLPFYVLFATLFFSCTVLAKVDLTIRGLSGDLKDNVDAYLSSISTSDYSTQLRFQSRLEQRITAALNALGYYHPTFVFEVTEPDRAMTVHVSPGEVVRLAVVEIVIEGEAQQDADFARVIERSGLKVGETLNHSQYDSLKSSLRNLALQKGYFDGDFQLSRLEVVPDRHQAFVRLHFDSGIRYHFGATSISGSQIEEVRVRSLQPFKQGDPYLVSQVGQFNLNLANTDWFSSVFVKPDLEQLNPEQRELPMVVALAPKARNQLETGIGYSTDVGVRGSLKWKKPWLNEYGHSFDSSLSISGPEQSITAGYKIPLEDVLRQYYRIQYGMKHVDNRDTESLESNLVLERHWLLDSGWHRTVFLRYLIESYEQGLQDDGAQFLMPGITYTRTRTRLNRSLLTWGDKQTITLEYADPSVISETRATRVQAGSSWVRSLGERHRGLFRIDGSANFADEFDKLSPSLRFFAGGDNNLRGYGYQSISPRDASGSLTGAKYMATSSLEYQYRIGGNWWAALFVDYGDAFNDTPDWKTGTGFGLRWVSPVGPLRLDFAWGLDSEPGDRFKLHFTLGPEL
ncbi:outer membrane protein assembly factor [Vibrio metschnikovii]|uniref:Translocation and assembly module subunit TamA n=2 Tax=Unclassified Bacteria TaxID=49928 RepID=A0AAU6SWK8_UNCXX|nr:autotransporter assembly complex family protein [Vibrio metschnikovii]EKO3558404.1 outer membrane protein assembly factor [Vibrio metschnikovii]EKO3568396.1 outer membrane protein assembly factor [Vibrio metschnikovii]EKO3585630.1 outer membrane protein assembly factor [Vibrio metschnikovii]EKO3596561.1 outer membrane protein assembly factor [Vibrio metschnikovii]EKO3599929.1 outer membrane protein assembly factor [Vibrio metschnikovii]